MIQKLKKGEKILNSVLWNRQDIIHGLLLAIMTKSNINMLGVPGTAKSMTARLFSKMFDYVGSDGSKPYFESEVHEFTTPTTLYGPIDMKAYSKDKKVVYNTENFLPNARIAFIDELPRGKEILETLLPVIHERVFAVDGIKQHIPLEVTISASNHKLDGSRFQALRDRFLQWFVPEEIDDTDLLEYMQSSNDIDNLQLPKFTENELKTIRKMVSDVKTTDDIMKKVIDIIITLIKKHEIIISDRRKRQIIPLIKAETVLNGRTEATLRDCQIIWSALWADDTQINTVRNVVDSISVPAISELNVLKEDAIILVQNWQKDQVKYKTEMVSNELKRIMKAINKIIIEPEDTEHFNFVVNMVKQLQFSVANILTAEMHRINI